MNRPLRIAVIGTGGIAALHLRHWRAQPGVEVVAVADTQVHRARAAAAEHGLDADAVVPDLGAALAQELDAVDLCTPPYLHEPQALEALAAGCSVILEKPLAGSAEGFDRLLAAERSSRRVVVPVLQNRLGLGPRQLRALVAAGLTGRFLHGSLETSWRRTASYYAVPWRGRRETELGGCLTGLAIHQLDVALEFTPPVERVLAHPATLVHPIEVEDCGAAVLVTRGGGWLSLTCSVHAQRESSRLQFVFEHLQVEAGPDPYRWAAEPWRVVCADPARQRQIDACLAEVRPEPLPEGADPLWHAAARVWCARLRGAGPCDPVTGAMVDLASARQGVAIISEIGSGSQITQGVSQ